MKAVQQGVFCLLFLLLGCKECRIKPPDRMAWTNSAGSGVERAAGGERLRKERLTRSISQGEQERRSPPVSSELTTIQWRHFLQKRSWCPAEESTALGLCRRFGKWRLPCPCPLSSILKVHPGLAEGWGTGCLDLRIVSSWELSSGERTVGHK